MNESPLDSYVQRTRAAWSDEGYRKKNNICPQISLTAVICLRSPIIHLLYVPVHQRRQAISKPTSLRHSSKSVPLQSRLTTFKLLRGFNNTPTNVGSCVSSISSILLRSLSLLKL